MDATHQGKDNTYSFEWDGKWIVVVSNQQAKVALKKEKAFLYVAFRDDEFAYLKNAKTYRCLVVKGERQPLQPMLKEVQGVLA